MQTEIFPDMAFDPVPGSRMADFLGNGDAQAGSVKASLIKNSNKMTVPNTLSPSGQTEKFSTFQQSVRFGKGEGSQ
jgi:hypothetical protein